MKNLKFTLRMLSRNPILVFVNIPGLAVGLSVVLLLMVYLNHEISFDEHFSTKDRVLRLNVSLSDNEEATQAICLRDAYVKIPQQIPAIEASTQFFRGWQVIAQNDKNQFPSLDLLYADPGFFKVFAQDLITGDEANSLVGKDKVVLSESTAKQIFGSVNCVGNSLEISETAFTVTGVMKDLPASTHFNFDLLASMETIKPDRFGGLEFFTYFLINENTALDEVGKNIASANDEIMIPWATELDVKVKSGTELLSDIHLFTRAYFDLSPKANISQILIIAGIALFILILAIVNFVNLYILHGEKRTAEISSRRSLGATKWSLGKLFYRETSVIAVTAFLLALLLVYLFYPYFSKLMNSPFQLNQLYSAEGIGGMAGVLLIVIVVAGAWPTFYLSKVNLVSGLKGKINNRPGKTKLTVTAVLVQFSITIFLLTSLVIIRAQINHLQEVPLGFNAGNVIGVHAFNSEISSRFKTIENELKNYPFVSSVGSSYHRMGGGSSGQGIKVFGDPGSFKSVNEYRVQPGFGATMQLELINGEYLDSEGASRNSVILNEAAVKMLGIEDPVGKLVQMHEEPLKIVGVSKDFYYEGNSGEKVAPLALTTYSDNVNNFYLRINGDFSPAVAKKIEAVFLNYQPEYIFNYSNLSQTYQQKFTDQQRVLKLVTAGSVLAIVLSFMGLMALSFLNVNKRTKEIGVRKVLGSTESEVILKLVKEILIWVIIASAIAFTADLFLMSRWLSGFANRITLHPGYFLVSGLFAVFIALLAVSWQSWRAATQNPVDALRDE